MTTPSPLLPPPPIPFFPPPLVVEKEKVGDCHPNHPGQHPVRLESIIGRVFGHLIGSNATQEMDRVKQFSLIYSDNQT